jgi:hypothetical protein
MGDESEQMMDWDVRRSWWPGRRRQAIAQIVASTSDAMLVRVASSMSLDIGRRVTVELGGARALVEIRHAAPTGESAGDSLVGIEVVTADAQFSEQFARRGAEASWWWQRNG